MNVDCVIEDQRWADIEPLAILSCGAALSELGLDPDAFEISLLACGDARIAELNADFRGKPQPTNVLSWPSIERAASRVGDPPALPDPHVSDAELGDIAIAYGVCASEAADQGKPMRDHTIHLLVHGTLHLLGYDHIHEADASLMEGLETRILGKLGIADPYKI